MTNLRTNAGTQAWARRAALAAGLALGLAGCSATDPGYDPDKAISVADGVIKVAADSPFIKHLEIGPLAPTKGGVEIFKVVGQIVALANSSDQLAGPSIQWAELDPALTRSLGLHLGNQAGVSVGEAYGLAELPAAYSGELARGDSIAISRYGLRKYGTSARVVSVQSVPGDAEWARVVFKTDPGEEWYPGNNCEVAFPMVRGRPVNVPTTALLHEGAQEFVLQALGAAAFKPRRIIILDTVGTEALVLGDIPSDARIVSRGAILLKPYLHKVLRARAAQTPKPGSAS